jgi:hypothetical protein
MIQRNPATLVPFAAQLRRFDTVPTKNYPAIKFILASRAQ